jgi:hypothetical protein
MAVQECYIFFLLWMLICFLKKQAFWKHVALEGTHVCEEKKVYIAFLVALFKGPVFVGKQNEGNILWMFVCCCLFLDGCFMSSKLPSNFQYMVGDVSKRV